MPSCSSALLRCTVLMRPAPRGSCGWTAGRRRARRRFRGCLLPELLRGLGLLGVVLHPGEADGASRGAKMSRTAQGLGERGRRGTRCRVCWLATSMQAVSCAAPRRAENPGGTACRGMHGCPRPGLVGGFSPAWPPTPPHPHRRHPPSTSMPDHACMGPISPSANAP